MMIKYLIKFISKKAYADTLLDGKLYMNAAAYYRNLEVGQGDECEGAISHNVKIFKNDDFYVYCMYAVQDNDLNENSILINEKTINDFKCSNGYLVLIKYDEFINMIKKNELDTDGFGITCDLVSYGYIDLKLTKNFLVNSKCNNLFVKKSSFQHQKEFRIVVKKRAKKIFKKEIINGELRDVLIGYEYCIFSFKNDLKSIAQIIEINNLKEKNGFYELDLNKF